VLARIKMRAAEALEPGQAALERPFVMKPLEEAFVSWTNDPQSKAKVALSAKAVAENRKGAGKRKKGCLTAMEVEHTLRLLGEKRLAHENIAAEVGICA